MQDFLEQRPAVRWLALLAMSGLTVLVYAAGLHGPFLLDDGGNLDTVNRWMHGRVDWLTAIDNRSGPLGRRFAMLTFLMDAARSASMNSSAFKPTNLAIHIACGMLVYVLARRIFLRVPQSARYASSTALIVAAVWLWLPLHVSTVLYVVQRMAQLSALCVFTALIIFMHARARFENRQDWQAYALLWIAVPAVTFLGVMSKESAALALPLAALIEFTLFNPTNDKSRPSTVKLFLLLTVAVPALAGACWLIIHSNQLAGGYALRDFTLQERLLTEPRVLWSYVQTLLIPLGPQMGLFHDNYPLSHGLLSPGSTLAAILAWAAVIAFAIWKNRHYPLISLGIGFFIVGHILESTVIPLEIYFEHRNYLPSFGLLIALTGAFFALKPHLANATAAFRRLLVAAVVALPLIYAAGTWVQAAAWSSDTTLYAMQEVYNPTSPRLQSVLAARAIEARDTQGALRHIDLSERFGPPSERMTSTIWRMLALCEGGQAPPPSLYEEFAGRTGLRVSTYAMTYWEKLAGLAERSCTGIDKARLARDGKQWVENDKSDPSSQNKWRTLYNVARFEAMSGDLASAEIDARKAWIDGNYSPGIGVFVFQLNATLGRRDACLAILARLKQTINWRDKDFADAVNLFQRALDQDEIHPKV